MPRIVDASDRVALTHCVVDGDSLVDHLTGRRHRLNASALDLLRRCDGRLSVDAVTRHLAQAHHLDPASVRADFCRFVATLEAAGLVRVRRRRRPWGHPAATLAELAAGGYPGAPAPRRRYPPTIRGCGAATLHAGRLLVAAAAAASVLTGVAVALAAPGVTLALATAPVLLVLTGLVTVAAHEAGHLGAVRRVGGWPAFVAASRNQVAVAHDVHSDRARRLVALAGPTAGATFAIAAWPVLSRLPQPVDGLMGPAVVLLAGGHLASLLPWFADGRHLWAVER